MIVKTKPREGLSPALLATQRKQPIKEAKGKGEISGIMTINQLIVLASHA